MLLAPTEHAKSEEGGRLSQLNGRSDWRCAIESAQCVGGVE